MASGASVGNIILLEDSHLRPWIKKFIEELTSFPQGKRKDQVDAASGAYNKLKLVPKRGTPIASGNGLVYRQSPRILVPRKELHIPGL